MKIKLSQLKKLIRESIEVRSDPRLDSMKQIVQDELDKCLLHGQDHQDEDVSYDILAMQKLLEEINAAHSFVAALNAFRKAINEQRRLAREMQDNHAMEAFNNIQPEIAKLARIEGLGIHPALRRR